MSDCVWGDVQSLANGSVVIVHPGAVVQGAKPQRQNITAVLVAESSISAVEGLTIVAIRRLNYKSLPLLLE